MAIVSTVEQKSLRGRTIHGLIILFLMTGGLTMIYPFAVMLSGSLRSQMDEAELNLVPGFLVDRDVLYRKFLETKYDGDVSRLNRLHREHNYSFRNVSVPEQADSQRIDDMHAFVEDIDPPFYWERLGGIFARQTVPENLRELRKRLAARFDHDLSEFGRAVGAAVASWRLITISPTDWLSRRLDFAESVVYDEYFQMLEEADLGEREFVSMSGYFVEMMLKPVYGPTTVKEYNKVHVVDLDPDLEYADFVLSQTVPGEDQPKLRSEWIYFIEKELNPNFVKLPNATDDEYQQHLREIYPTIEALNRAWATEYDSFEQISLPDREWLDGTPRQDYERFLYAKPVEDYLLVAPEYAWREWLAERYGTIEALNEAHQASYRSFDSVPIPQAQVEYNYVVQHAGALRWDYAIRNYVNVFDELVFEGRALFNTVIYLTLCVTLSLLINPLAAYAMSRFNLPGTYKFLLIFMATVAFPPMVTLIPQFIVMRKLDILNTFLALILPYIMSGHFIFLLKGFFDNMPTELYEAARVDGASELRMFFQMTMALSKPILAVVALQTFQIAYMAFLYPLLVAPDEDMWLITVWMFQFQQRSSSAGVYASVVIAAVPTLTMFLLAQRFIMRGVAVSSEK
jgi:multiple sugar transport system permease protein